MKLDETGHGPLSIIIIVRWWCVHQGLKNKVLVPTDKWWSLSNRQTGFSSQTSGGKSTHHHQSAMTSAITSRIEQSTDVSLYHLNPEEYASPIRSLLQPIRVYMVSKFGWTNPSTLQTVLLPLPFHLSSTWFFISGLKTAKQILACKQYVEEISFPIYLTLFFFTNL